MSVGDGPQTPGSCEQDWENGRIDWEEMMGWDVRDAGWRVHSGCASSSREDPGEALDDTPVGPAHYPFFTEEYSSMILWEPSRGLLMEKVIGRYRFLGGTNEPFLFEGRSGNLECDTRPTERELGTNEITAGREIGTVCLLRPLRDTPLRSRIVERWGRSIRLCFQIQRESHGLGKARLDGRGCGTGRPLDKCSPCVGRCQPFCVSFIRSSTPTTLNARSSLGSADLIRRRWEPEQPLGVCSPRIKTRTSAYSSLTMDLSPSTTNIIISAILSSHTHIPNTIINILNNKHTITLDHALLLITGKNNTYPFTLREKPTHKKTYNKYTHHLKIKREKELTLLFYISCIQNKKHKENQKQKEKKKNKQKKNTKHLTIQLST